MPPSFYFLIKNAQKLLKTDKFQWKPKRAWKMTKNIRQPVVTVIGHVDHGKSTILESIREISITQKEAGGITQKLSSIDVPLNYIKKTCGKLLEKLDLKITLPGILFIDTPGHAAFTNLRKRGGNLADIAILVIDINEGVKPQTIEAVEILKGYKTPFIVALNKIDLVPGWQKKGGTMIAAINSQDETTKNNIDAKLYEIVGKLYEIGFGAERFDRVEDYTKQVALIPVSAKTKEGIPEMLMVLTGLAQRYLQEKLKTEVSGHAKGTILEVREEKGLGTILDAIIYEGRLTVGDTLVIGGLEKPIITKARALFLQEKGRPKRTKEVTATAGVIIYAPESKEAIAGMPIRVAGKEIEKTKEEIKKEVQEVIFETDKEGITIKAESLGSLEALTNLLHEQGIRIKKAGIGKITKKDIAETTSQKEETDRVILGFNVGQEKIDGVKVITGNVIYRLIDDLKAWQEEEKKKKEAKDLQNIPHPCKLIILHGYVFRQSNPAIVGAEVIVGRLKAGTPLFKKEKQIAVVKSIQYERENAHEIDKGKQAAISLPGIIIGRQIAEGDILYSDLTEEEFKKLKKLAKYLKEDEVELLKEIARKKREANAIWGI